MTRPVHYSSAGSAPRFFECYRQELVAYLDKRQPKPTSRTDVGRVTCPHCLFMLSAMVTRQAAKHGYASLPPKP